MSSDLDICNLALAHVGNTATVASIDPPESSVEAAHCARFYPMARDELLEMANWSFATRRADLAALDVDLPDNWLYAYALPSGCLKPLRVLDPADSTALTSFPPDQINTLSTLAEQLSGDDAGKPYVVETLTSGSRVLYTNVEDASLVYIVKVTNSGLFSPLFVSSLSVLLASYLAGPLTRDANRQLELRKFAEALAARAVTSDANQRRLTSIAEFAPGAIIARA